MAYPVCPSCGGQLFFTQVSYRAPFNCPLCGALTELAPWYSKFGFCLSLLLTLALSIFLGFRGIWIVLGFVVLPAPVMFVQILLLQFLFGLPLRVHQREEVPVIGASLLGDRTKRKNHRR